MGSNISGALSRTADKEEDLNIEDLEVDMKWEYIVLICINMLIILPISVHMSYNYYLKIDSYMYNARRPWLVTTFNIVAILFVCLYTPIHIIIMEIYWKNNAKYEEWWDSAFFFTAQICVFVVFAIRTWHSFYDFQLAHSCLGTQWKSILDQRYQRDKTNFFLKHQKTLGKPRKTYLYFLIIPATIFFIIFITTLILEVGFNTEYGLLILAFVYLVTWMGVLIYIIKHTWRHVYDNIHLRGEILLGCVVLCVAVALELITFAIDLIEYSPQNEKYQQVFNFSFNIITCSACFALIVVNTQYVRIKVKKNEHRQHQFIKPKPQPTTDSECINRLETMENEWIYKDQIDFQALISTPDGLNEFLDHLAKEYELNLLVFAMEVTQYKTYVVPSLIKKFKSFVLQLESSLLVFPADMPKSSLVYPPPGAPPTTERRMFTELCEKYIHEGADWKIRISAQRMNAIVSLYRRCQMDRSKKFSVKAIWGDTFDDEALAPINTMRFPTDRSSTIRAAGRVSPEMLKEMVDTLDGALNDVIALLQTHCHTYKQTDAFTAWFARLSPANRDIITRNYRHRKLVERTEQQQQNMTDCKEWRCKHCTLMNRAIHIKGRSRMPKSICMCCGSTNDQKNVLLRTKTLMANYWHSRVSSKHNRLHSPLEDAGLAHSNMDSMDESLSTQYTDDENEHEIVAPTPPPSKEVHLDPNIVTLWEALNDEIEDNTEDNQCEGVNSEYVDSCPKLQKLQFVMRCYNYYLNKKCECDKANPQYKIASMAELVNHLQDLSLQKLLDIYQHVSTVHFVPEMFDYFEESLGKCGGGKECKPLSRNNGRRGVKAIDNDALNSNTKRGRNRERDRTNIQVKEDEKEEEKYEPFRPLRRTPTVCKNIDYVGENGKKVDAEERITLSYLDKWHSFLFHPNVKQKQNVVEQKQDEEEEDAGDIVSQTLGSNSNKFVTDASKHGILSKLMSGKLNLLKGMNGKSYDDVDEVAEHGHDPAENDGYTYYEYNLGEHIPYHTHANRFVCMKQELIGNDVHTVTEKVWDDTLAKALLFLEMESVRANYEANDHGQQKEYGVKCGELIGVDNVVAILFYCNFDELQNEFSKTFRKKEEYDTEQDIIDRHCKNFYWFGRALFVAINFYGQRMQKNQVVWHGLSSRMLFERFAAHFDSPTSTTTQKNVAQTFSGNGHGIILKLKSKHNVKCAWMLDVSLFSDYTDECERLFLNETLIITDILTIVKNRWVSFKNYIGACLYFEKITSGNATDATWNIKETPQIQNVLSRIIDDFMAQTDDTVSTIPHYIRVLFRHYCMLHKKPRFDDIDKIQHKMLPLLQQYFFDETIDSEQEYKDNKKQTISQKKVQSLFPSVTEYINDQKELVSATEIEFQPETILDQRKKRSDLRKA
eukprot:147383_1